MNQCLKAPSYIVGSIDGVVEKEHFLGLVQKHSSNFDQGRINCDEASSSLYLLGSCLL